MSEYQFHHLGCGCGCNDYLRNPKDAEIERLRAMNYKLAMLVQEVPALKKLITELCDALDIMTQFLLISDLPLEWEETKRRENQALIQRAREATR